MKPFFMSPWISLFFTHGVSGVDTDGVFVTEGDSVTLNTDVKTNQNTYKWYSNGSRIAQMNTFQIKICTDDHCKRFRDRLKLDHQTGSLTVTNTRSTDTGEYTLKISSNDSDRELIYKLSVHGVSTNETKKSAMEGDSVTLDSAGIKNPNNVTAWYFNDTAITRITGDQIQICTDDRCKERFGDRLMVDHQTGSLTITNTRDTDSGEYQLQINSSRFSITRSFSVNITSPGQFSAAGSGVKTVIATVSVPLLLLFIIPAVVFCYKRREVGYAVTHTDPLQEEQQSVAKQHIEDHNESPLNQTETSNNGMAPKKEEEETTF